MLKVLLIGGGTGGHLYPLLTVARKIKELKGEENVKFLYIGPINKFSKEILKENGIKTRGIFTAKWRRYFSILNFLEILLIPIGFLQSLIFILIYMPDVVFSKGGYGSVLPAIVSRLYFIPILIHESDVVPGKSNLLLSKLADIFAISFHDTKQYFNNEKVYFTGNPVRRNINDGDVNKAVEIFKLRNQKPVILILGGSQGSQFINRQIIKVLKVLLRHFQIIHQVGSGNLKEVKKLAAYQGIKVSRSNYHPYEFLGNEIIHAYKVASLIISRAGAMSISEIAAVAKPSILIPLASGANNHQVYNAYAIGEVGGSIVIKENNLRKELFLTKISDIMNGKISAKQMAGQIAKFYFPDAAEKIAFALLYLAKEVDNIEGKGFLEDKL
jgi:UDP-N-acetylglucosamine--N-acetylmuramyl-(pentapeptide) pyrophosphoryl-undecaprenol N-acetylglucosamine transferase